MDQKTNKANASISCTVAECKHHNNVQKSCNLSNINIACCGPTTSSCTCTECNSFHKK